MKTLTRTKLFLAALSVLLSLSGFNTAFGITITVTSPNGGESWIAGTTNAITWTSDATTNLRIVLLKNGVQHSIIAGAVPNTGSFNWAIPAAIISGTDYAVKISSCLNPTVFDVSDANFSIVGGSGSNIAVTAPNGGENWVKGTQNIITWTSDITGNVRISLLKNGSQYSLIAASVPNTGTFSWLIPGGLAVGTDYKVKVSSVFNPLISDMSDANFSIIAGGGTTITVTSPNGGETWTAGTINTITWTSDVTGYLRILLFKNGLQNAVIAGALPNTGTYSWIIPAAIVNGTDYTVKIQSCLNPAISDVSDANFSIVGGIGSNITVTAPNGGENWVKGIQNIITWTSDITGNVRISLLKNGSQYSLIAASVPNTGTFSWLIPGGLAVGSDYKVKVSGVANPLIYDMSDANFTISGGNVGTFITVTSPNGGESWIAGTPHAITWTSDLTSNLRIVLFKNGLQYMVIAGALPNTGTFNWLIPATMIPGAGYTVKISSCIDPLINDVSDGNFSITASGSNSSQKTMTGTSEITNLQVMIYPNPATDKIDITADRNIECVKLLNGVGQIVMQMDASTNKVQLNVEGFKSGIYFIRIETGNTTSTRKLMIK